MRISAPTANNFYEKSNLVTKARNRATAFMPPVLASGHCLMMNTAPCSMYVIMPISGIPLYIPFYLFFYSF
jgi:hypothetical protein